MPLHLSFERSRIPELVRSFEAQSHLCHSLRRSVEDKILEEREQSTAAPLHNSYTS